eukprot:PhF_6_TR32341/c0_g1_i3/m.47943
MENAYESFIAWAPIFHVNTITPLPASWTYRQFIGTGNAKSSNPDRFTHPIVCISGLHGDHDAFYRLFTSLAPKGYTLYSIDMPTIPSIKSEKDFCMCLDALLTQMGIRSAHFVGVHLGGFLVQC